MFKDKTFSIAFLISISWHLICMFFFTIVILPVSFPMSTISNVSFLGPLLEKTAFELMLDKNSRPRGTSYQEPMISNNAFLTHEDSGLVKLKFSGFSLKAQKDEAEISAHDLFGDFKVTPDISMKGAGLERKSDVSPAPADNQAFLIEGPLSRREIAFKPEMPVVQRRVGVEQKNFIVELKIKAAGSGQVEEAALLVSSGYPDVDLAAINYIKGVKFSEADTDGGPVWDKVKLNIRAQ